MTTIRRALLVAGAAVLLATFVSVPGGAQTTTETVISWAGESSGAGFYVVITPPGDNEPAAGIFGAETGAKVTSAGPRAEGFADALSILGNSPARAESSAPPTSEDHASGPVPVVEVPGVATIGVLQFNADSASTSGGDTIGTENAASSTVLSVEVGNLDLPVLGQVGADVTVSSFNSDSNAGAVVDQTVDASASSNDIIVSVDVGLQVLENLCSELPNDPLPLQEVCDSLVDKGDELITAEVRAGVTDVACGWSRQGDTASTTASCDGSAATLVVELLGQEIVVSPGQTVQVPPGDGPFVLRVKAGTYDENESATSASAVANGLLIEVLGTDASQPGVLGIAVGESTAAVSGEVQSDEVIPRTGTGLLPLFLGGSALAAGGLGLRRFLRRRRG